MQNIFIIAKKEFSDLLSNGMVILVLSILFIYIGLTIFKFNNMLSAGTIYHAYGIDNFGVLCAFYIFYNLYGFCAILGVMIGCGSISNEYHNYALNTLLVKPLYRDTIINGKLIGSMAFIFVLMALTAVLYTSIFFVLYGDAFYPFLQEYAERTIVSFGIMAIYVAIFFATSMLTSIIIKDHALSLIFSLIIVFLSKSIETTSVAGNIALLFPGEELHMMNLIASYTPAGLIRLMEFDLFNPSVGAFDTFQIVGVYFVKFLLLFFVPLILSYIIFIRKDVR